MILVFDLFMDIYFLGSVSIYESSKKITYYSN